MDRVRADNSAPTASAVTPGQPPPGRTYMSFGRCNGGSETSLVVALPAYLRLLNYVSDCYTDTVVGQQNRLRPMVAVTMSREVVAALDTFTARTGETRSAAVEAALWSFLSSARTP